MRSNIDRSRHVLERVDRTIAHNDSAQRFFLTTARELSSLTHTADTLRETLAPGPSNNSLAMIDNSATILHAQRDNPGIRGGDGPMIYQPPTPSIHVETGADGGMSTHRLEKNTEQANVALNEVVNRLGFIDQELQRVNKNIKGTDKPKTPKRWRTM